MKRWMTIGAVVALVAALAIVGFTAQTGAGHGQHAGMCAGRAAAEPGARVTRMFERLDANNDGVITKDEFKGPEQAFARMDANGDGKVTQEEATQAAGQFRERAGRLMDPAKRWEMMLERHDANQDGKLTKDEFPGPDELFARIDANGDGAITEDEMLNMPGPGARMGRGAGLIGRMDQDGDGKVTKDEWVAAFDKLDTNGDGVLDAQDLPHGPAQDRPQGPGGEHGAGPNAPDA